MKAKILKLKGVASIIGALAVMLTGLNASLAEDADSELGPPVGAEVPHSLDAKDHTGAPIGFDDVVGENGLVLLFFRSADWCPYCQNQLIEVNKAYDAIKERGYELAAISYDEPVHLAKFKQRRDIAYSLMSDEGSEIIDAFGIRNNNYPEDHYGYGVPHPIIFVLDTDGVIQDKLYEKDWNTNERSYRQRPEISAILASLDRLNGAESASSGR